MPATTLPSYCVQRRYDDFDELTEEARQWDLDFRQLDRGRFCGEVLQFGIGDIHVSEACFSRSLVQRGSPPTGLRTIVVPASPSVKFIWRGQQITGGDLAIFPRGADLSSTSTPGFHVYTCSFPEQWLAMLSDTLGIDELDKLRADASVVRCDDSVIQTVRTFLSELCETIRSGSIPLTDEDLANRATRQLPERLLGLITTSHAVNTCETARRRESGLIRAERFIEQFAQEDITVRDICRAAQVSQRTLEYAFTQRFGLTPKAFLIVYRLNGVRRELRAADPIKETVTDIANRWGFWHLGQFAADYRKRFDELPSQTLRQVTKPR